MFPGDSTLIGDDVVRNDSIERAVNDSIMTIAEYILQMREQAETRKGSDVSESLGNGMASMDRVFPTLPKDEREKAEFDLYHALIIEHQPALFEINGQPVEMYPAGKDSTFQIHGGDEGFYGVYKKGGKEPYRVTKFLPSCKEVLTATFGTHEYERFRDRSFFIRKDGTVCSPGERTYLRFPGGDKVQSLPSYENIESARLSVVREQLKNDPAIRNQALKRTLEHHHMPFGSLLGKTVSLMNISKSREGVTISVEDEKPRIREIRLPDLAGNWHGRIRGRPGVRAVFDEIILDSKAIAEGFMSFYGMEINRAVLNQNHDFEIVSDKKGWYIARLGEKGKLKRMSPYFTEKEAGIQLRNLKKHILLEKERGQAKEGQPDIEFKVSERS
jgi:hypothetical protein